MDRVDRRIGNDHRGLLNARYFDVISPTIFDRRDYHFVECGNKTVSAFRDRLNEPRIFERIAKRFAKPHDRGVQAVVKVDEGIYWPQPTPQVIPADHPAAMIEQQDEDLERLLLQL